MQGPRQCFQLPRRRDQEDLCIECRMSSHCQWLHSICRSMLWRNNDNSIRSEMLSQHIHIQKHMCKCHNYYFQNFKCKLLTTFSSWDRSMSFLFCVPYSFCFVWASVFCFCDIDLVSIVFFSIVLYCIGLRFNLLFGMYEATKDVRSCFNNCDTRMTNFFSNRYAWSH